MTGAGTQVLVPRTSAPSAQPGPPGLATPGSPDGTRGGTAPDAGRPDEWPAAYGRRWRAKLGALGVLVAISAALASLGDPDLPMHLALGQWIVAHRGVPFTEPFAWTRAGAPFYAYSWLPEVVFSAVAKAAGGVGLRVLHGALVALAGAAMLVLGRAARWSPQTSLVMAFANVIVAGSLVPSARPQILLFVLVPLAWACAYAALGAARPARPLVGLLAVSALAANSHLLFPLTAAPWSLVALVPRRHAGRAALVVAATVLGWLLSPYGASWVSVFALNFGPNALLTQPSPVAELWPGFLTPLRMTPIPFVAALALAAIPWVATAAARERVVFGVAWLVGLVAFGSAVRALLVWWVLVLPMAASAVARIDAFVRPARTQPERLGRIFVVWLLCATFIISRQRFLVDGWRAEDPVRAHRLPSPFHERVEPLAAWLDCHRPRAAGRVLTGFAYGSQLTWRLPRFSMSIDSRNIFPDSVARSETYVDASSGNAPLPPWRSAELAVLPLRAPVAQVLDTAAGWRRVAVSHTGEGSAALWVTAAWWARTGADPLPARAAALLPGQVACR